LEGFIRWILVSQDARVAPVHIFSYLRDEYIVKKYIEKRWVATIKVPDIPSGKKYLKQEARVINFVSSWKLTGNLKTKGYSSETPTSFHMPHMRLLKRGEIVGKIDDGKAHVRDASHHGETFAAIESVVDKPRANNDSNLSAIAAGTLNVRHETESFLEIATPGLDDFDFKIPQSFMFNIMSPNVIHANHPSSETSSICQLPSATKASPSKTNIDGLDVIILVCDVGTQTE
jgi:hypothetical protein